MTLNENRPLSKQMQLRQMQLKGQDTREVTKFAWLPIRSQYGIVKWLETVTYVEQIWEFGYRLKWRVIYFK